MKKDRKNIATAAALSLLCIGILGGVVLINRRPETAFVPAASEQSSEGSWNEPETKPLQASIPKETESQAAQASIPKETESQEAYFETGSPEDEIQVVANEGEEVVINLTPPVTKPATEIPPEEQHPNIPAETEPAPESAPETAPAPASTENQESAPSEAPAPESTPAADDHAGQVYDPVFGWLTPGNPQADVLDNDGDVNKQIGYIE